MNLAGRLERFPLPALGAAGGVVLALGLPPLAFPPLAALGVLAFVLVLDRATTTRSGALAGGAFGGAASLVALHWVPAATEPWLGPLGGLAAGLSTWMLHASIGGAVVAASARLRATLPLAVRAGAAWGVLEWLPGAVPLVGIPWFGVSATLTAWPTLLPVVAVVGSGGLGILLAAALGGAVRLRREPRTAGVAGLLVLVVGGGVLLLPPLPGPGVGADAAAPGSPAASVRVAALEWERPREEVADLGHLRARFEAMLDAALPSDAPSAPRAPGAPGTSGGRPRLVLWPEAPLPRVIPGLAGGGEEGGVAGQEDLLTRYLRKVQASGISGVAVTGIQTREGGRAYNALVRTANGGGAPAGRAPEVIHRKRRLVPGVERTVLTRPGLAGRGLAPGARAGPFDGGGVRVGGLICFEVLYAAEVARLRRGGAQILVQATNDAMLQPGGPFPVVADAARRQHEAVLQLRAAEFRMPAIRAAHGGRAQASGPDGRRIEPVAVVGLGEWEAPGRWLEFELLPPPPAPPAAWVGPALGPLALAILLLPLIALGLVARKDERGPNRPCGPTR